MPDTLIFEKNPHMRGTRKTSLMMLEFFIVVLILYVASVLFYFIKGGPSDDYSKTMYGLMALQNGLVGVGFAVIADLIWYFPYVFRKEGVEGYISKVLHSYSYVSGLILVLLLPIGPEWWEIALTSFVAVFFTKLIFGGFGSNIMNPAIFGRIFAQVCFSNHLTTYLGDIVPEGNSTLISAGATIPGLVSGGNFAAADGITFWNMLLGNYYGTLGETFALIIVILCIYLVMRRIIDWRVPFFYVVPMFFSYAVAFLLADATPLVAFEEAARQIMMGGILFGAVFCLTDPVTSPTNKAGRIIFALGAAILTMVIRLFTNSPEGVAYSILIMNIFTPLIDKCLVGRTMKNYVESLVILVMIGGVFAVGCGYGLTSESIVLPTSLASGLKEVL
ncbi:MAG TPA: RnfABCDGE type electron transport complex subunit D [Candidatus Enterosoma merdigallinarum]|nr:RnfABCDGE type electron transport complex subunit D [Candidatus Enterosoma merdigallinarum]